MKADSINSGTNSTFYRNKLSICDLFQNRLDRQQRELDEIRADTMKKLAAAEAEEKRRKPPGKKSNVVVKLKARGA